MPHEIGVFVRSEAELERARAAVAKAGLPFKVLDERVETTSGQLSISTMYLAKGQEASRETYQVDRRVTREHATKQMGCAVTFAELP